jgi:hypothetical protein
MKTFLPNRVVLPFYFIGTILVFLMVVVVLAVMYRYTQPPAVDHERFEERRKALTELRAQAQQQLENYGWVNPEKRIVRLPIRQAMELTVREWQDPVAGRSNLIARSRASQAAPAAK